MKTITQTFPFPRISKLDLSHSSRGILHSCPRKLEFRKIYNNSRRSESLATGAGQALHAGVQSWLEHHDDELAIWEMIKQFPMKYQKTWADQRSLAACYETLMCMLNWDRLDEFELAYIAMPDGSERAAVEVPFNLQIKNYPFFEDGGTLEVNYIGFMDLILYSKIDNEYAVWDIKTSTKSGDQTVAFRFDEQCVPYALVLEALMGHDINLGFDVNYWFAYIHPLEPKNTRYNFHKTKGDLQDWMQGYMFDLDMIRRYYNLGWFARHTQGCMAWNRPCNFFDFCESRNPKVIEAMLDGDAEQTSMRELPAPWATVELDYE